MRERRKTKDNKPGSGASLKVKWLFYDIMNFLDCYLQRRTTSGNVTETSSSTEVSLRDTEQTEIDNTECEAENTVAGCSKKEQPPASNRGGKRKRPTADDIDTEYLDSLNEIGRRMEETSSDCDRMCLQSNSCHHWKIWTSESRSKKSCAENFDVLQLRNFRQPVKARQLPLQHQHQHQCSRIPFTSYKTCNRTKKLRKIILIFYCILLYFNCFIDIKCSNYNCL